MESGSNHFQVVIVGGGIGGLTLGACLRRLNISYRILERTSILTPQGAAISLAPNCLKALDQLGLYEKIQRNSQALYGIDIYREREYWGRLNFGLAKKHFGYHVHSMERHEFHRYLYEAADGANTVELGFNVIDIIDKPEEDYVIVKDPSGKTLFGDVVVGADGVRSVTRRILARNCGLQEINTIRFTGRVHMSGYTAPLKHLDDRSTGVAHWMLYDDSILTTWPCKENRQWFIGAKQATLAPGEVPDRSVWKGTTTDTINAQYGDRFHPFSEDLQAKSLINHAERVVASNVFEEKDFPVMAEGRIALLGDAAHSMTSFFGQGACQAIEDAVELANTLAALVSSDNLESTSNQMNEVQSALARYRHCREARAKDLVSFSSSYARLHTANVSYGLGPLLRAVVYKYLPSVAWMWYLKWLWGYQPVLRLQ